MNAPTATLLTAFTLALAATAAHGDATMTAGSCTGIDSILVVDPPLPPASLIDPVTSPEQFSNLSFDDCITAANGFIKACAVTDSGWVDLAPNLTTQGFEMSGQLNVAKPTTADTAVAKQTRTITFVISGVTSGLGNSYTIRLSGSRTTTLPAGIASTECTLKGPTGNTVFSSTTGNFSQNFTIGNGTFTLILSADATLDNADPAANGILTYAVSLTTLEPTCGDSFAGDCYTAHNSPACSMVDCCELVCSIDPTCCSQSWDADCSAYASAGCAGPLELTGPVYDPFTKRFTQLFAPRFWWKSRENAQALGGDLLILESPAHDEWTRRVILDHGSPEGLPAWIGLTDEAREANFRWVNDSPLSFTDWRPGQPLGGDYVAVDADGDGWIAEGSTSWLPSAVSFEYAACGSSGSCYAAHITPGCSDSECCTATCIADPFCCQTEWDSFCVQGAQEGCVTPTVTGPFIHPINRHRYYVVSPTRWKTAVDLAFSMGGTLAIPETEWENVWLWHNLLSHDPEGSSSERRAWLGLDSQLHTDSILTTTGEVPNYTHWLPGEPEFGDYARSVRLRDLGDIEEGSWDTGMTGLARGIIELPCEGDLNDDGEISAADLSVMLGSWQGSGADLTGDGITDAADLSVLLGLWGPCPTTNSCTPHATPGSDAPGCTTCVCELAPACCEVAWDATCVSIASFGCEGACMCGH
jgi:hypothetical protein